jgi:hypothetical protein
VSQIINESERKEEYLSNEKWTMRIPHALLGSRTTVASDILGFEEVITRYNKRFRTMRPTRSLCQSAQPNLRKVADVNSAPTGNKLHLLPLPC